MLHFFALVSGWNGCRRSGVGEPQTLTRLRCHLTHRSTEGTACEYLKIEP